MSEQFDAEYYEVKCDAIQEERDILLEALQEAELCLEGIAANGGADSPETLAIIRAAIAKAEGNA